MQDSGKIILGIDPGTLIMGYSVIECRGRIVTLHEMQSLKLHKRIEGYERLHLVYQKVTQIIQQFKPHELAIEAPFFGKNVQSMLKLGRAQGVAIAAAMQTHLPVTEYSPRKIKQSITGNGNAAKEQVWKMLQQLLSLKEMPDYFDATDALAVAMCHHYQLTAPVKKAGSGGNWEDFIKKNPGRIIG